MPFPNFVLIDNQTVIGVGEKITIRLVDRFIPQKYRMNLVD